MRGKLYAVKDEVIAHGLIPAHAGKTAAGPNREGKGSAHPRACGENPVTASHSIPPMGSSPRMRGKRICRLTKSPCQGLIPAHAGKTQRN